MPCFQSVQEETEAEKKREKEIEQYIVRKSFVNEDEKFFAYAYEILDLAKKKGRPTYPIEKVIRVGTENQFG